MHSRLATRLVAAATALAFVLVLGSDAAEARRRRRVVKKKPTPAATTPSPATADRPAASGRSPRTQTTSEAAPAAQPIAQRESHIEFDERLVQGQTATGAVYLFQRATPEFRTLIEVPDSFRTRTVGAVTGEQGR